MAAITDPLPFSVDGKTALVTGAGSGECRPERSAQMTTDDFVGINYCFAKLLLSRTCNVVIADLALRPEAQELVDKHSSQEGNGPRAIFVKTDVIRWDDLTKAFEEADKEFGGVDIVCPGAGIFEPHWSNFWHPPGTKKSKDSVHGTDGIGHYATLDINLTHPIRVTQLAMSRWLSANKASVNDPKRIVHISSIAGQAPGLGVPLYTASKHAISGFIRSLASLDDIGIRVNGVAPGIIKTPLWTEHPEKLQMINAEQDSWVEPDEVAKAMLRCVEDPEVGGGYVMEVLKNKTRRVDWRMDPGPQGPGSGCSNKATLKAEVFGWLAEPGWGVAK